MSTSLLISLSFVIPLCGAILITLLRRHPDLREAVTLTAATALFSVNIAIYQSLSAATSAPLILATPLENLPISFSPDSYGVLFALVASGLWIVTSIYSIGYMRSHQEKHQTRFYTLFAVALAAVMAIAYSDNLFTLFLFYEVLSVSTYPLVTHAGTDKARRGGRIYLTVLMGSSIFLFLPALAISYFTAGHLTFTPGGILQGQLDPVWVAPLLLLFMLGIAKAGLMPVHKWLPSAMVAPTPVSALLHAVAVVKAGVFTILKVVMFIIGPEFITSNQANDWLLWLPMITIVTASLIAMSKDNIKERLAYSTISQLSYIVLGAVLANSMGLLGGSLHIVMHAFAKITLFFAAGAVLVATHKTRVSELSGLGRDMPLTFSMFTIATLSIIGMPLFGGMWSKWYLMAGAADYTGPGAVEWALLITLMLSTLLNIAYLLIIPVKAFFGAPADDQRWREAPLPCLIGMAIPTLLCIYMFFDPHVFFQLANSVNQGVVP